MTFVTFFNDVLLLKVISPKELSASRLVALVKPNKRIRPIAVGESIYRVFSSLVFSRILNKAQKYLSPFQYGIKTIDGASVAALTSELLLDTKIDNFVFNLDFKNAFNSVKRAAILTQLQEHFPELESFFHTFYGNSSDLVYNSADLSSLTGVKQGDPLGPFFFCLAIHPILNHLKYKYKDLEIVAYMDDISFIAPFETIQAISADAATLYEEIGLNLNNQKCFVIGKEPKLLTIRSIEVPFNSYSASSFRFLGCFFGKKEDIVKNLDDYLNSIQQELDKIKVLEIEKHLKFFMLKICCSGKITHLLRSFAPELSYDFCRAFNKIRTDFLPFLLQVNPNILNNHTFSSPYLGGLGFTSSKWWTKAAFIGGGTNFVFEFCNRYPSRTSLLESTSSFYLNHLRGEIGSLSPELWSTCFPVDIKENPCRNILSLKFALKKLQNHLLKYFESLDFTVRLSLAKEKNPAFAHFLIDLKESSAVALINQIPQVYGLLLNDHQWTTS
ncbi:hypothetical protein GEMRC1_005366 [Eukaryota sp. GEM-RC1]